MGGRGSGGQNKKPEKLHILDGTIRKETYVNRPAIEPGKPPRRPAGLTKDERWLWDHMVKYKRDWLEPDDAPMLIHFCKLWGLLCHHREKACQDPEDELHIRALSKYSTEWTKIAYRFGLTPLPPYIHRDHDPQIEQTDRRRYQTIYARLPGSVAAPTAGLHFTSQLLQDIQAQGIHIVYLTLHVGLGTFQPITTAKLQDHHMPAEYYQISPSAAQTITLHYPARW